MFVVNLSCKFKQFSIVTENKRMQLFPIYAKRSKFAVTAAQASSRRRPRTTHLTTEKSPAA